MLERVVTGGRLGHGSGGLLVDLVNGPRWRALVNIRTAGSYRPSPDGRHHSPAVCWTNGPEKW